MSQHDDLFAAVSLPQLLAMHGVAIVYRDDEGDQSCTAVVTREEILQDDRQGERNRRLGRKATFTTNPGDADFGGVAAPKLSGTIEVGGVVYAIESLQVAAGANFARAVLTRPERREVARANLRGGR